MIFGYARVSTTQQDPTLQIDALTAVGVDEIITDQISGTRRERPGLDRLLDKAREGDVVVVWRLDRLARSMKDLLELVETLKTKGVGLRSLHEDINTTTANGMLILHIFAALAQFEAALLKERTLAGLQAARAQGRIGGRKPALTPEQVKMVRAMQSAGISKMEICRQMGVARATLYRHLEKNSDA
ncbi:MAG: recombinase family protein [Aeromonas sp.]